MTKLLSRLNICCSDKQRYDRENRIVHGTKDSEILPSDPGSPVAIAWDNNDMHQTARFASAEH